MEFGDKGLDKLECKRRGEFGMGDLLMEFVEADLREGLR
jgi:hypothetical protein